MPTNGGSNEYQNIISSLGETSTKIDAVSGTLENEFSKKVAQEEVENSSNEEGNHLATAGTVLGSVAATAFFQPSLIDDLAGLVGKLGQSISSFKLAAPAIGRGGMGGVVQFLSKAGPMLGRLAGIVGIIATVVIQGTLFLYQTIDNKFIELNTRLIQAETNLSILTASYNRTLNKIQSLERGVINNEQEIHQLRADIEAEMASLEQLIKENHAQSLTKFEGLKTLAQTNNTAINTKLDDNHAETKTSFQQTFDWQINNGAAPTATLTKAALERPDGMLEQTKTKLEKATEGDANDADYRAAIAGGTAIAAGTIGAAAYKNRTAIQSTVNNGMNELKNQGKKLGALINLGQILQVITLLTTAHNALILSRDIGQTLFNVVDNGLNAALNAFGVKNVDDEGVNSAKAFKDYLNSLGQSFFGAQTWAQIQASWAAANRITASANTLLWSVRDLADTTSSMAEMAAENSGKIGNALRRSGITQDVGRWFPENYSRETVFQQKMRESLENVQNVAEAFENITSSVLSAQQTIAEIDKNNKDFKTTLETEAPKIRLDNKPVKDAADASKQASQGADITEADTKQSREEEDAAAS